MNQEDLHIAHMRAIGAYNEEVEEARHMQGKIARIDTIWNKRYAGSVQAYTLEWRRWIPLWLRRYFVDSLHMRSAVARLFMHRVFKL